MQPCTVFLINQEIQTFIVSKTVHLRYLKEGGKWLLLSGQVVKEKDGNIGI